MKKKTFIEHCKYCGGSHPIRFGQYLCPKVFGGTVFVNRKKEKTPRGVLSKLAEEAIWRQLIADGNPRKVGEMIKRLPEKDRKILRKLKSKDIKNDGLINPL
jgi:hypothetical protein